MKAVAVGLLAGALFALASPGFAQTAASMTLGGDQYAAGQQVNMSTPAAHDVFAAGYDVNLSAPVAKSAHLAGFNVNANATITGDLYAGGFSVKVTAPVGGDITAIGNNVTLDKLSSVAGNIRLGGETVTIAAPVQGSALVSAKTLNLGSTVTGDVSFFGESISFAEGAKVTGKFLIEAPKPIAVPASVAAPEQITYKELVAPDYANETGRTAETVVKQFWPQVWATISWFLLLFIVGALLIAFAPATVLRLKAASEQRPFRKLGFGILTFAMVLGLVPAVALTVIGLLLVPFVLVFVAILCTLGYLAGTYFLGARLAGAFVPVDSNLAKVIVLAVALLAAALLGMVPFLGWLITLTLVVFGQGVIFVVLMVRWTAKDAAGLAAAPAAPLPNA